MSEDTNGLSREQVEALAQILRDTDNAALVRTNFEQICADYDEHAQALAPTVAAMLAEARAEVVRRMRPVFFDAGWDAGVAYASMPSAVREGGTERSPASRDSAGPPESAGPSDGRTGPHECRVPISVALDSKSWSCPWCGRFWSITLNDGRGRIEWTSVSGPTVCGEALGDMRCQLTPGHTPPHEDYRGVAQERRG